MDEEDDLYIIREHHEYTEQLKKIAQEADLEVKRFYKALNMVFHILSRNPRGYPLVNMSKIELRMAKTEVYVDDDFTVPPLRIYFIVRDDEKCVELMKIEKTRGFGLL